MLLRGFNIEAEPPDCSFKPYDYKLSKEGKIFTAEIKNDRTKSNNLAIECSYKDRDSGIYSTESDIYFIYADNVFYAAYSEDLRSWISDNAPRKIINSKNLSKTEFILIPKSLYQPYTGNGERFFILTPKVQA